MIPWTHVQHTAERVAIVASGPSLKGVDLRMPHGIDVIAVNGALPHLPSPAQFWFTLDCSPENRTIMRTAIARPETTFYAAALPHLGQPDARPRHLRAPPELGVLYLRRFIGQGPVGSLKGLSDDPTGVHAGNSAYGALGLAYLMGAKRVALLGVDGNGRGYAWGHERPGDLQHLGWLFNSAAAQLAAAGLEVVVGSARSRVSAWPRMSPAAALRWVAA